jgi:hypothetical protein
VSHLDNQIGLKARDITQIIADVLWADVGEYTRAGVYKSGRQSMGLPNRAKYALVKFLAYEAEPNNTNPTHNPSISSGIKRTHHL